jgi:superfamily II DNA or RNA helicase
VIRFYIQPALEPAPVAPPAAEIDEYEGVDLPMPAGMELRDYQVRALEAIRSGWKEYSRQLVVMATGTGKTVLFSHITSDEIAGEIRGEVRRGGRVLILAHTEELLDQARDKLQRSTGIEADREKAEDRASLDSSVVIASVQTLCKDARLLGFADDHFSLVIVDETHRILAPMYQKIVCYFHFGERSLDEGWTMPAPGIPFRYNARILGVTATDDRGDRKNLGQFFQNRAFVYGLKEAVLDGYLVRPVLKTLPLKIDVSNVHMRGKDLDAAEIALRLDPLLKEIARQVAIEAGDRKTMIWLPSVDSARRLSLELEAAGMQASFVSGACPDRADKIEAFRSAGRGAVICNAMLLTEGVDIADVDCVCMLRPTRIRSLMVQAYGRATRVLNGVIDGLLTKEERLAAIAASMKPNMLILDFLWLSERLDMIKPADFLTSRADVRDLMAAASTSSATDLLDLETEANRDLLESLAKAAKKHENKMARVLDPLDLAVALGDTELATWQPVTAWDELPAMPGQLDFLRRQGIDADQVKYRGHARQLIVKVLKRLDGNLVSPRQLQVMKQMKLPMEEVRDLTRFEASMVMDLHALDSADRRATAGLLPGSP